MLESGTCASVIGNTAPFLEKYLNSISISFVFEETSCLMPPELPVDAATLDERPVRAFLGDGALLKDDDAIHLAQRRETMRYRDHGLAAHELVQRFLDQKLALAIEGARRLVEKQDGRI